MSVDASASTPGTSAAGVAEDLRGLPRPTTGRTVVLVLALLGIGFTAGNQIHNSVAGDDWLAAVRRCAAATPGGLTPGSAEGMDLTRCLAPAEQTHALYVAAGAALVILGSAAYIAIAPSVIRRRKHLKPVDPRGRAAVERVGELATRIGLRRPPILETAGPSQREVFCSGRPGAPAIALPLRLISRVHRGPEFEPVMLHELAHIKHRDVALSWLASGFLAIALVAAFVPVAVGAATGDLTAMSDYLWRVVALIGVGWLIARAVLRVREFDADLTASIVGDADALRTVLTGPSARPSPPGIRRYLHHHPSPAERVEVLVDPGRIADSGFLSGFIPATLVCALVPSIKTVAAVALTGVDTIAWLVPGAVIGAVLLAVSVGVDVARSARVGAGTGVPRLRIIAVCLGAAAGATLGHVVSPEAAWRGPTGGLPVPTLLFGALLVCGATAATCGIARAVARRRINWFGCVLLTALPWGFAFWLGQSVQVIGELGFDLVRQALTFNGLSWPAAAIMVALLVTLAWALRRQSANAALVGVAAAIAASAVMIAADLLVDGVDDDLGRLTLFTQGIDQAVLAAVAAAVVLALATGVRGAASGGIAAATAGVTATLFFGGFLWCRDTPLNGEVLTSIGMPLLAYPVGVWLAVASAGLIVPRRTFEPPLWMQSLLAAALATTLVAAGSAYGPFLAPEPKSLLAVAENSTVVPADYTGQIDAGEYRYVVAPTLDAQFRTLLKAVDFATRSAPDSAVASWLATEVSSAMSGLEEQVEQTVGTDEAVTNVHSDLVTAVDALSTAVTLSAEYHRDGDPDQLRQALGQRQQAVDDHQAWLRGVATL